MTLRLVTSEDTPPTEAELREGMNDHHARCAVRDLIKQHGAVKAGFMLSLYLAEESRKVTYEQ